jgi:hypothetical protein
MGSLPGDENIAAEAIAMEPAAARRQRKFLEDRIVKLGEGHSILKEVMRST